MHLWWTRFFRREELCPIWKAIKEGYAHGVAQAAKFEEQRATIIKLWTDVRTSARECREKANNAKRLGLPPEVANALEDVASDLEAQEQSIQELLQFTNNERDRWHGDKRWMLNTTISLVSLCVSRAAFTFGDRRVQLAVPVAWARF